MDRYLFAAGVLVLLLLLQSGWSMGDGECIMEHDLNEAAACCHQENIISNEVGEKCYHDVMAAPPSVSAEILLCVLQCDFETLGVVANDKFIATKYIELVAQYDDAYRAAVTKAVTTCGAIEDEIRKHVSSMATTCNGFSLVMHMCLSQVTMDNCPADRWSPSTLCAKVKAGVPAC